LSLAAHPDYHGFPAVAAPFSKRPAIAAMQVGLAWIGFTAMTHAVLTNYDPGQP
jgi:hypothetical protein